MTGSRIDIPKDIRDRAEGISVWVRELFADRDRLLASVPEWPEPLAEAGFRRHRETWSDVEGLVDHLVRELEAFGGPESLEQWVRVESGTDLRAETPERVFHLWPAVPGTGVAPVLFGALLGVPQVVSPSSRSAEFAELVASLWSEVEGLPPLEVHCGNGDPWWRSEVVVVSGTDETLRELRRELMRRGRDRATTLVGYGHRVSLGVVPEACDELGEVADALSRDAILWNQAGCLSLRGVLVEGDRRRTEVFADELGRALGDREDRWSAVPERTDENLGIFERRLQRRQVAEFDERAHGDGFGWAELRDEPFRGDWISLHTVTCHPVDGPEALSEAVDLAPVHLQGAALPVEARERWSRSLHGVGVTRICAPGDLQSPPADWLHDGRMNIGSWIRATTRDGFGSE